MDWTQLLLTALATLVGALVTLIVARKYYEKASEELRKESQNLRLLNELILRALEQADLAEFSRDEDGNILGLKLKIKVASGKLNIKGYAPTVNVINRD